MKVAIIGGGPAGFAAAITIARKNHQVTIFEKNPDVLKKLLLTGNGRCNYWNSSQDIQKYHSSSTDISHLFIENNLHLVQEFWDSLGIIPTIKNGYYYPYSEKSSSIKSALVKEATVLGVNIICNLEINDIKKTSKLVIIAKDYEEEFDKVIIATGSYAYPKTGSTGWGYKIASQLKHRITLVAPSLVQLITQSGLEKSWAGIRTNVIVKHLEDNQVIKEEAGEIQLTDYGVSGICIFNLSRNISIGLSQNKKEEILINFVPWCEDDLMKYLDERSKRLVNRNITELCDAFLNYKLLYAICAKLHIDPTKAWQDLSSQDQKLFCDNLTAMRIGIVGTKSYDNSQVCSGGVSLQDLDDKTFESKIIPNLYFAGELLDLDGDCGGYNLTIAILTGIMSGMSIGSDNNA